MMKRLVLLILLSFPIVFADDIQIFIPIAGDSQLYVSVLGDEEFQNYFIGSSNCENYLNETACLSVGCTWCSNSCYDRCPTGGTGPQIPITGGAVIEETFNTRFVAVYRNLFAGEYNIAYVNVVESFRDKYYCPEFDFGIANFFFTHAFAFLLLWLLFSIIVRRLGATKNRRRLAKCCIYLFLLPLIVLVISLMIPSCGVFN